METKSENDFSFDELHHRVQRLIDNNLLSKATNLCMDLLMLFYYYSFEKAMKKTWAEFIDSLYDLNAKLEDNEIDQSEFDESTKEIIHQISIKDLFLIHYFCTKSGLYGETILLPNLSSKKDQRDFIQNCKEFNNWPPDPIFEKMPIIIDFLLNVDLKYLTVDKINQ